MGRYLAEQLRAAAGVTVTQQASAVARLSMCSHRRQCLSVSDVWKLDGLVFNIGRVLARPPPTLSVETPQSTISESTKTAKFFENQTISLLLLKVSAIMLVRAGPGPLASGNAAVQAQLGSAGQAV